MFHLVTYINMLVNQGIHRVLENIKRINFGEIKALKKYLKSFIMTL